MAEVVRLCRPLDRPITFTQFPNVAAKTKSERTLARLRDIAGVIQQTQARTKGRLPLLTFARFSGERTAVESLRHDTHVVDFCGVVGDHDTGA